MADDARDSAEAERRLARYAAIGIPAGSVLAAIAVGLILSLGPAILVLLAGTLLGTIALLWASLRTLSGDAPLPLELEAMAARTRSVDDRAERKRRVLRALKDLELEHAVGKIDDKDFASLDGRFRDEAKAIMREMDDQIEPLREEAEKIAQKYLAKRNLADKGEQKHDQPEKAAAEEEPAAGGRVGCSKCSASNEPDATFCKKCGTSLKETDATP